MSVPTPANQTTRSASNGQRDGCFSCQGYARNVAQLEATIQRERHRLETSLDHEQNQRFRAEQNARSLALQLQNAGKESREELARLVKQVADLSTEAKSSSAREQELKTRLEMMEKDKRDSLLGSARVYVYLSFFRVTL